MTSPTWGHTFVTYFTGHFSYPTACCAPSSSLNRGSAILSTKWIDALEWKVGLVWAVAWSPRNLRESKWRLFFSHVVSLHSLRSLDIGADLARKRRPREALPYIMEAIKDQNNLDAMIELAFLRHRPHAIQTLELAESRGKPKEHLVFHVVLNHENRTKHLERASWA